MSPLVINSLKGSFLGFIQGITEFLPVSSSGHLAIFKHLLQFEVTSLTFDIFLHFGSLLAIIIFFFNDIKSMITFTDKEYSKNILVRILIGILPAGLAGLLLKSKIEVVFTNLSYVGCAYLVSAVVLICTLFLNKDMRKNELTIIHVIIIGFMQILALIPGVSRSGITIATALLLKVKPETAGKFSFYMAIPLIGAATLKDLLEVQLNINYIVPLLAGMIISFIISYLALKLLFVILRNNRFGYFGFYCLLLSLTIFIF